MSIIVLLVGPSGCGKSTIANRLCSKYAADIRKVKSYTTRKPRIPTETDYHFCTKEEFDNLPDHIAVTVYNGESYCTTSEELDAGQVYIVDPAGVKAVRRLYAGSKTIIAVGITAPEAIRYNRMIRRGDSEVSAYRRIEDDRTAFKPAKLAQLCNVIMPNCTNQSVDNIVETLHKIICGGVTKNELQPIAYKTDITDAKLIETNAIVPVSSMIEWAQCILSLIETNNFSADVRENLYSITDGIEAMCGPISVIEPILPGFKNGVLRNGDTSLSCASGVALSDLPNDEGHCVDCPHQTECTPDLAKYVLSNGALYNGVNTESSAYDAIIHDYIS